MSAAFTHASAKASGKCDRLGDISASVIDLIDEYAAEITELLTVKAEIKDVIDNVKDDKCRLLLEWRYLNLVTWERIAVEFNMTYQGVCKMHGRALKKVCELIEVDTLDVV
jgi:hypothetical protein